jgi:hypothetical protein
MHPGSTTRQEATGAMADSSATRFGVLIRWLTLKGAN